MFGRAETYIVFIIFAFFLASCGGEEPQAPEIQIKKEDAQPLKLEPAVKEEEEAEAAPELTAGEIRDMRNPFQTFIVKKTPIGPTRIKGPLECCELTLFKVLGVVSGTDNPRALVLAPDGKKYSVKTGDRIGIKEGRIIAIEGRNIIVKELTRDDEGAVVTTENVELSLPGDDEEQKRMQ